MDLKFKVTPGELKEKLRRIVAMENPPSVFLWGKPGIGKTSIVYQVAQEFGKEVRVMILSLMDPVELKGFVFPDRRKKVAEILPLNMPKEPFVLFFDEFNTAPVATQNAALRVILEKRIGDLELPRGTLIVCAGNRIQDKAMVSKISSAMVNRVLHYTVEPNFEDFKLWWYEQRLPEDVIAFLEMDNAYFCKDPEIDRPFPTPRSWEMVGRLLQAGLNSEEDIAGAIGEEAALRFQVFRKSCHGFRELVEQVLEGKKVYPKENEVEKSFMLVTALVSRTSMGNVKMLLEYANQAPVYMKPYILLWIKTAKRTGKINAEALVMHPDTLEVLKVFTKIYGFAFNGERGAR